MIEFIQMIFKDPLTAVLGGMCIVCLYNWRELAKHKVEICELNKHMDDKKLDRGEHLAYIKAHREVHDEANEKLNIIIDMLRQNVSLRRESDNKF